MLATVLGSQTLLDIDDLLHTALYICVCVSSFWCHEWRLWCVYNLSGETFQGTVNVSSSWLRVGWSVKKIKHPLGDSNILDLCWWLMKDRSLWLVFPVALAGVFLIHRAHQAPPCYWHTSTETVWSVSVNLCYCQIDKSFKIYTIQTILCMSFANSAH